MIVPFHVSEMLRRVRRKIAQSGEMPRMAPRPEDSRTFRTAPRVTPETVARLHRDLGLDDTARAALFGPGTQADLPRYARFLAD